MRHLALLAALAPLAACPKPVDCTTEARSSVSLTVVDDGGAPIPDATVTFTLDGGEPTACEAMLEGSWVCGWEQDGTFEITADAEGFGVETRTYEVGLTEDECHVETVVDEIVLSAVDCTTEEVPGVAAHVTDGTAPIDATVTWRITDSKMAEQPCDRVDVGEYRCAYEQAGPVTVTASDDVQNDIVDVVVEADECHVITEDVDLVLPPQD